LKLLLSIQGTAELSVYEVKQDHVHFIFAAHSISPMRTGTGIEHRFTITKNNALTFDKKWPWSFSPKADA
jgi:hypothetical protein